jgi:microcystin-dependent protein
LRDEENVMALLSTVIGRGLAAARPASGATGALYYSTDSGVLERWSGSAWESYSQSAPSSDVVAGIIVPYAGLSAPTGWLLCDGSSVARATYVSLWEAVHADKGAATITITSPGVVTFTAHALANGSAVHFTTTGALPTGLSPNTTYYIVGVTANTFNLALTRGGTAINTSGSQSGVHTLVHAPFAVPPGSTTHFLLPDTKGRVLVGGGSTSTNFDAIGEAVGAETHTLTIAEMPAHTHTFSLPAVTSLDPGPNAFNAGNLGAPSTGPTGGGGAHNNIQPSLVVNAIIKT